MTIDWTLIAGVALLLTLAVLLEHFYRTDERDN